MRVYQMAQTVRPVAEANLPAPHAEHAVARAESEKEPSGLGDRVREGARDENEEGDQRTRTQTAD